MSELVETYRGQISGVPAVEIACPAHGAWVFPASSVQLVEFRTVHEYCRAPVPVPPAPPVKSRRSAL